MICLFVTVGGSLTKRRFLAREDVPWQTSMARIANVCNAPSVHGLQVSFPTEEEFFGAQHTAEVSLL